MREDEEQKVKLTQTVELLLAAGYFRARIKGLSDFDKVRYNQGFTIVLFQTYNFCDVTQVVGGMTWCISTCSFDLDVDLLFQENSTIGQKM